MNPQQNAPPLAHFMYIGTAVVRQQADNDLVANPQYNMHPAHSLLINHLKTTTTMTNDHHNQHVRKTQRQVTIGCRTMLLIAALMMLMMLMSTQLVDGASLSASEYII